MTLEEARAALQEARPSFYQYPFPVKVYIHWTAGHYGQAYNDYHFCIDQDGSITNTRQLTEVPTATYHRNTGSIAIALEGCAGAAAYANKTCRLGDEPITDAQIEACAQLMAVIADVFGIPIDIEHFLTHEEAADNIDGYNYHEPYGFYHGCERWDLIVLHEDDEWGSGGDTLRGKAIYYQNQEE